MTRLFSLVDFANDKYKILKCLYDNQIQIKNDKYTVLSQEEISSLIHFSKNKTNEIMQQLRKERFIDSYSNIKGKYIITKNGNKVIEIVEKKY